MSDPQILALVRFAYPGLGGFQTEHDTVAARQAHLWHPDRLEARFRTLEHLSLRTLAAQTDRDFRTLIVTGDTLPEPWRTRLLTLARRVPGAEVVFHPPMNQRHAMEEIVNARIDPDGGPVIQFRHDDDDGVGCRFVARCRETLDQVRPLWQAHGRLALDFNKGFMLRLTPDGPLVEEAARTHLGVAQALILRPTIRRTAVHFPHHRLGLLMPSVTLPDARMWLRGVDGTNDSRMDGQLDRLRPASPDQRAELEERFGLDLAAATASF
ncbi:putative rhamnosyl transferase [Jannaschia sp. M317]|uniref:putative rhamnosyl transferase n=1 Tax=Jannaschia sp. M317 TaxID=2867011 RepID=UPI0021A4B82E|nr:putative rhamnosyl transferase [Jannaschia sp. M317]UWQ17341.1 putative rhamnosyl transferase [Jannaschia sp. M317]